MCIANFTSALGLANSRKPAIAGSTAKTPGATVKTPSPMLAGSDSGADAHQAPIAAPGSFRGVKGARFSDAGYWK